MTAPRLTIAAPITPGGPAKLTGRGLFTGNPCTVALAPAAPGTGILFTNDSANAAPTRAIASALTTQVAHKAFATLPPRNTSIDLQLAGGSTTPLFTIEHLCSALVGLGVHDCLVTVTGNEIPILDGSALDFVRAINAVGTTPSNAPLNPVTVRSIITVEDNRGGSVTISPASPTDSDSPTYSYHLDYGQSSPIQPSTATWDGTPEHYAENVAPARTFCLESEAQQMKSLGLFEGLTPKDLLVIAPATATTPAGPIDNEYRFPNEPARHKLLDLIGDLSLVGTPLLANVTAIKSGHALHHKAAQAVLDSLES